MRIQQLPRHHLLPHAVAKPRRSSSAASGVRRQVAETSLLAHDACETPSTVCARANDRISAGYFLSRQWIAGVGPFPVGAGTAAHLSGTIAQFVPTGECLVLRDLVSASTCRLPPSHCQTRARAWYPSPVQLGVGARRTSKRGEPQNCLAARRARRTAPEAVVVAIILTRLCVAIDNVEDT
jgi:hypothetical protein